MNVVLKPILRWAGGKTTKINQFRRFLPPDFFEQIYFYVEPCIGSGAFFFSFYPQSALISDLNIYLINVYKVVRDYPDELINQILEHAKQDTEEHFYDVRDIFNGQMKSVQKNKDFLVQMAANLIFINCRCYNGLYRVNKNGEFNVGYYHGSRQPTRFNGIIDTIPEMSKYLRSETIYIESMSYESTIDYLDKLKIDLPMFFIIDPPYYPIGESGFTSYNVDYWDEEQFYKLKEFIDILDARNYKFLLCNSDTKFILDLFSDYRHYKHKIACYINSNGAGRGKVGELVIINYNISNLDKFMQLR